MIIFKVSKPRGLSRRRAEWDGSDAGGQDIITGDELISDAYKMQDKGVIYEVDAKRVTKGADNIRTAPLLTSFALCFRYPKRVCVGG